MRCDLELAWKKKGREILSSVMVLALWTMPVNRLMASPVWMKELADETSVKDLSILGTHNSCALYGGDYGACQSLDLKSQLDLGVRFLDIRCQWKEGDLHIVHGIVDQKLRFSEVIKICEDFLKKNPSEMLLMSVMEQRSKNRKKGDFGKAFSTLIKAGKEQGRWYQNRELPQVGKGRGKVVVVSRNAEVLGVPWRQFSIQDKFWISKDQSLEQKWQAVKKQFSKIPMAEKPSINFLSCTGIFNPPNFTATKLNPRFMHYLTDEGQRPKHQLGIVVVDFVTPEMWQAMWTE